MVNASLAIGDASSMSEDFTMLPNRDAFDRDACPVGDDLLGELYRANENGLPAAVAIASTCSERELSQFGGRVGSVLYAQSRDPKAAREVVSTGSRKPISLSTKPLSAIVPLDDDLDDPDSVTA
jgi:hypothetical protein